MLDTGQNAQHITSSKPLNSLMRVILSKKERDEECETEKGKVTVKIQITSKRRSQVLELGYSGSRVHNFNHLYYLILIHIIMII